MTKSQVIASAVRLGMTRAAAQELEQRLFDYNSGGTTIPPEAYSAATGHFPDGSSVWAEGSTEDWPRRG